MGKFSILIYESMDVGEKTDIDKEKEQITELCLY